MVNNVCGDIFDAAFQGNVHLLEALLSTSRVDIDEREDDGSTPLIVAAQEGHTRVTRALLHAGASVYLACDSGWTALMASSSKGHLAIVKLLASAGAKIGAVDCCDYTALNAVVEFLIGAGSRVHCPDNLGLSPLHRAALNGHLAVVKLLASAGAELDAADNDGDSALNLASNNGHSAVVKFLAGAGAGLECPDSDGKGPLHKASQAGHVAVVNALLAAGADQESYTLVEETPLFLAAINGRLDVVRVLLRASANPAHPMILPTGKMFVALDAAARQGHREIVRELLALGVDTCGGPRRGVVGLCLAAQSENLEMLATLRDGGVVDNGRALYDSCNQGRDCSVRFLLRQDWGIPRSTYVNARNDLGYTPLWLAAGAACPRIVRWLLDAGADETVACGNTNVFKFEGSQVTPLGFANDSIRQRSYRGRFATEEEMERMQAVRRLLLRVDAVRALSWVWCAGVLSTAVVGGSAGRGAGGGAEEAGGNTGRSTTAVSVRIARNRRRAATKALFRYSNKA
eukprot:g10805.t1